jgi:tetratricopeptide (TPR) repeat protein
VEQIARFFSLLAGYAVRWRTKGGLARISVILLAATGEAHRVVGAPTAAFIYTGPAVLLSWLAIWLIGSGRVPLPPRKKTIAFAIDVEVEAERNFNRIFRRLSTTFDSLRLSQPLAVKRIASDLVNTERDADRYVQNYGVTQVVWGRAISGTAANVRIQRFEVHWLQRVPPGVNVDSVISDLKLLERGRKWSIAEVNDLIDVEVVAEDFLEVSLAIVGILFVLERNYEDAATLFKRVVDGLDQHHPAGPARQPKLDRFREIYNATRLGIAARAEQAGDYAKAVYVLEDLLPVHSRDFQYRLVLARASFLAGDFEAAVRHTNEAAAIDQSNPAIYANRAFFCIRNAKYKKAGDWYDKLARSRRDKLDVLRSVSEFLENEYEQNPNEHAYLYGMAIVDGLIDPSVLVPELQRFLDATRSLAQYEPLRASATLLIGRRER